ncbi:MAG: fimbrillin family protein, partial [Rikenellaceae bacterium]
VQRENPDSNNAIAFSTYAKQTKGTTFDNTTFAAVGREFGVTAFVNTASYDTPYMGATAAGAQITCTSTSPSVVWGYKNAAESRFWPALPAMLTFYGYTPFASTNRGGATLAFDKNTGMTFTNYVVPNDVTKQEDFMWARAASIGVASPVVPVPMNFGHALVRVNFKAQTTSDNLKVDIEANGITLGKIKSKGTFVVAPTGAPTWTPTADDRLAYTIPSVEKTNIENAAAIVVSTADNAVMLMPQTFNAWVPSTATSTESTKAEGTSQTGGYIKVMCKIYTLSADASAVKLYLHGSETAYAAIYIPLSSQSAPSTEIWKANNNITYTLQFGGGYSNEGNPILNPIKFTTTVTGWTDIAGGDLPM